MSIVVRRERSGSYSVTRTGRDSGGGTSTSNYSKAEAKAAGIKSSKQLARDELQKSVEKQAAAAELIQQAEAQSAQAQQSRDVQATRERTQRIMQRGGYNDFGTGRFVSRTEESQYYPTRQQYLNSIDAYYDFGTGLDVRRPEAQQEFQKEVVSKVRGFGNGRDNRADTVPVVVRRINPYVEQAQEEVPRKESFGKELLNIVSSPLRGAAKVEQEGFSNFLVTPKAKLSQTAVDLVISRGRGVTPIEKNLSSLIRNPSRKTALRFVGGQAKTYTDTDVVNLGVVSGAALVGVASPYATFALRGAGAYGVGFFGAKAIAEKDVTAAATATALAAGEAAPVLGGFGRFIGRTASRARLRTSAETYTLPPRGTQTTYVPSGDVQIDVLTGRSRVVVDTIPIKRQAPGYELPGSRNIFETATKERQLLLKQGGQDPFVNRGVSTPLDDIMTPLQRAQRQPGQSRLPEYGLRDPIRTETKYLMRYREAQATQRSLSETQFSLGEFGPKVTESGFVELNIPKPRIRSMGKRGSSQLIFRDRSLSRSPSDYWTLKVKKINVEPLTGVLEKGATGVRASSLLRVGAASTIFSSARTTPEISAILDTSVAGRSSVASTYRPVESVIDLSDVKPVDDVVSRYDTGIKSISKSITKVAQSTKQDTSTILSLQFPEKLASETITKERLVGEKLSQSKFSDPKRRFVDDEDEKRRKRKAEAAQQARKVEGGYATFIKSRGVKRLAGSGLSRTAALDLGATLTKRGLGASFEIKRTSAPVRVRQGTGAFARSASEFREYRIVKGQKVSTPGVFIQKRGFRLGTKSERTAIQYAKRRLL